MTADSPSRLQTDWLSLPDVAAAIGEPVGRVRRLLDDRHLIASRRDGVLKVPALFIKDDRPLPSLRGTVMVLQDAGFDDDAIIDWLLEPEETIGQPPLASLLAGRKSEVRRVAQTLM